MYSICTERPDMVEFLLKCGCEADEHDRFGKTALHFAVTNNSTDCLKLLLDYGADVHSIEELGRTPLWVAASEDGHHGAIVCLLEAGADVNLRDRREKRTPLHVRRYADEMAAIRHTKKDTILYLKTFLESGSVVNTIDESGHSPLSTLIQNGSMFSPVTKNTIIMAKMLLAAGFDVNLSKPSAPRQLYGTALKAAVNRGSLDLVNLLLESGADPDIHDQRCVTPLIWSAFHNQLDISKSLIAANCNLDTVGRIYVSHEFHHATALHCALLLEHFHVAKLLVSAGCSLRFEAYLITNEDIPMVLVENFEFWGWLRDIATNTRPLSEICQKAIRKTIGFNLSSKVEHLPLPTKLKHHILLSDVLA
ncbi:hypothetical protein LSH36_1049g00067 [Paralvinella palmiformis]|uniref:SOCS box domain-containing protein n=1 Tax=Paralvinella palmiformis TaxID=53620 RepID=A0AAD9MS21_9ANNE|nr:hypothetical protein LSH36_1049g00067 [Paralvinella palmiformis]